MGFCDWSLFRNAVLRVFSNLAIISLAEKERTGCFTLFVLLLLCGCNCFMSLPHGAVGLSVVRDCGVSWSYTLALRLLIWTKYSFYLA